jgi:two-component system NtrC family sensor kinase
MAAIGQLAAGVAHELNTPLGAISIAIELSRDLIRKDPERAITRLGRALESVEQMQSIISKLLSYSRDSRGLFAEVDLNGVVHSSFQLVEHTLKLAGVEAQLMPGPELTLMGNANELQQVFSNLLLNAKDACLHPQARKKRIEVWLESQPGQALVHLRDYGSGMDESTRLRIFDPFFTTKPIGEGTGLGLSTSLELIEQHGGKIAVKSNPGEGTHFVVSLPLEVSH